MANEENLIPFKKGESGNPSGRPKGRRNTKTILKEFLNVELDVPTLDGTDKKMRLDSLLVGSLFKSALYGNNIRAYEILFKKIEELEKYHEVLDEDEEISEQQLSILSNYLERKKKYKD